MKYPSTDRQRRFLALVDEVRDSIAARAERVDRENVFPYESFRDLHQAGLLALTIPERFGGPGANPLEFALVQERIGHACGATGLASAMHLSMLGRIGDGALWPEEIYGRICSNVIQSGALINAVNSEPDLGSPSRGALPSTTAERTPTGWRINGRKRWASLAPALTYIYSLATAIDGDEPPHRANFLIPANAKGVSVEPTWDNLGMRGTASHDIVYQDVEVGLDARLPAESGNPSVAAGWFMGPTGAVYLGIAQAARDAAVAFAKDRKPNGMAGSIAELQTIQHKVAEMDLLLLQSRTLLYDTVEEWVADADARVDLYPQIVAAKYSVTNTALRVTDLALRVTGSAGLFLGSPLQRFFRDARTALGHPPMEDAILTILGKTALGLPLEPVGQPAPTTPQQAVATAA